MLKGSVIKAGTSSATLPLKIVSIGGGNGLSTLLRGLKRYAKASPGGLDITAIVTVTDDGGSSGRLRREFDVLPPGDIRNCMVALSEDEALLSRLFQYRFSNGRGLKGHSFGNLFLTAMTHLTGDFGQAVQLSSEVLAVLGRIYPSTAANVALEATLEDGTQGCGGNSHQPEPVEDRKNRAAAASVPSHWKKRCEAIADGRPDYAGPGIAVHQRDSEPAGEGHAGGDRSSRPR